VRASERTVVRWLGWSLAGCISACTSGGARQVAHVDATSGQADGGGDSKAEVSVPSCLPDLSGGPKARGDSAGGVLGGKLIVLWGDQGVPLNCNPATSVSNDAWRFTPCQGWSAQPGDGMPPKRIRAASATDHAAQVLYVYGGRDKLSSGYKVFGELWKLDAQGTWTLLSDGSQGPPKRSSAVLVLQASTQKLWLFGGNASADGLVFAPLADLWSFDLAAGTWTKHASTGGPKPREFHAGAVTSDGQSLVIVGGGDANAFTGPFLGDAWRLDLASLKWTQLPQGQPAPMKRIRGGLLAIPGHDKLLYFGGHDDGDVGHRNDLWWLDPADGTWTLARIGDTGKDGDPDVPNAKATGFCSFPPDFTALDLQAPERREAFLWDWDPGRQRVVMFGGKSDCGALRDVWTWDPATLQWASDDDTTTGWSCARYLSPCNTLCN
jgi:hypothetical protein